MQRAECVGSTPKRDFSFWDSWTSEPVGDLTQTDVRVDWRKG